MKLYEFPSGDTVHKYKNLSSFLLKEKECLEYRPNNGGFTTDLAAVFNNDANPEMAWRLNFGRILTGAYGYFSKGRFGS